MAESHCCHGCAALRHRHTCARPANRGNVHPEFLDGMVPGLPDVRKDNSRVAIGYLQNRKIVLQAVILLVGAIASGLWTSIRACLTNHGASQGSLAAITPSARWSSA